MQQKIMIISLGCIKKHETCLKNVKFSSAKKYDSKIMIFDNHSVS